jgi:hypothetical protein
MTELRNAAIAAELERAIARGSHLDLFALLRRFSGLPAPHANEKLAWGVAHAVGAYGARADALVRDLCATGRVAEKGTAEFLPIVGAFCLAVRFMSAGAPKAASGCASGASAEAVLRDLRPLSEDSRHLVRAGAVAALAEMGRAAGLPLVEALAEWTDGYLSASVALEAMSTRAWLDGIRSPEAVLSRFDEAFTLVEGAPRADQRSQGYRDLLKTLPEALAKMMDRFTDATVTWLESKAGTEHVELREALGDVVAKVGARGHARGKLEHFEKLFAASAPPRRDPKTYVGPTRQRGSRRR